MAELAAGKGPSVTIVFGQDSGPLRCRTAADLKRGRRKTQALKLDSWTEMLTYCTRHTSSDGRHVAKYGALCAAAENIAPDQAPRGETNINSAALVIDEIRTATYLLTKKKHNTTIPHTKTDAATRTTHKRQATPPTAQTRTPLLPLP